MNKIELAEATAPLAEYVPGIADQPVLVTEHGKPIAVLALPEDVDRRSPLVRANPGFTQIMDRSLARQAAAAGMTIGELRRRLGLDRAETHRPGPARHKVDAPEKNNLRGPGHQLKRETDDFIQTIELGDATPALAQYARQVAERPILVTENGEPIAVLVLPRDVDLESLSLATNPWFMAIIQRSRAQAAAGQTIPMEEMFRSLGLDDDTAKPARKPRGRLAAPSKRGHQKS